MLSTNFISKFFANAVNGIRFLASDRSTELMRLTDAGKLGIGTDDPAETLDVVGKVKSNGSQINGAEAKTSTTEELLARIASSEESAPFALDISLLGNALSNSRIAKIFTKNVGGSAEGRIVIQENGGNVVIGSNDNSGYPFTDKLRVSGSLSVGCGAYELASITTKKDDGVTGAISFVIDDDAVNVNNRGKLVITNTENDASSVSQMVIDDSQSGANKKAIILMQGGKAFIQVATGNKKASGTSDDALVIGHVDSNAIQLMTANAIRQHIAGDGKIGFATASPSMAVDYANKCGWTADGGFAIVATAAENLSRGNIVYINQAGSANTVTKSPAGSEMPIGVVYADATTGNPVVVVVSGIAYVLGKSTVTLALGYVVITSSEAGRADHSSTTPVSDHWKECGHVIGAASGNGGLAKCVLHFN